jgi:hypothetical protein
MLARIACTTWLLLWIASPRLANGASQLPFGQRPLPARVERSGIVQKLFVRMVRQYFRGTAYGIANRELDGKTAGLRLQQVTVRNFTRDAATDPVPASAYWFGGGGQFYRGDVDLEFRDQYGHPRVITTGFRGPEPKWANLWRAATGKIGFARIDEWRDLRK